MTSRDAFLAQIRDAAAQGRPYRVHSKPVPEGIGYLGAGGDLVERFALEVDAVGGQAFVVADLAAAGGQLQSLLQEASATTALCWQHDLLDRIELRGLLSAHGVATLDHEQIAHLAPDQQRAKMLACDAGITSCDIAIAETGTLVMCSRPGQERVASLLPPLHVALVERKQIVPDLIDALAALQQTGLDSMPSNITLITGPSKTGDIELQLTTGVHGPAKWRVVIIDS